MWVPEAKRVLPAVRPRGRASIAVDRSQQEYKLGFDEDLLRAEMESVNDRYVNAKYILLVTAHLAITRTVVNIFSCAKELNGRYTLVENPDVPCFEGTWYTFYMPIAMTALVLWVTLMPIRLGYVAMRAVRRRKQWSATYDEDVSAVNRQYIQLIRDKVRYGCKCRVCVAALVWRFRLPVCAIVLPHAVVRSCVTPTVSLGSATSLRLLATRCACVCVAPPDAFMRYHDGASGWETVIIIRRSFAVFFSAMTVYSSKGNMVQSFGAFLVYFAAMHFHERFQPYNDHTLNQLDDISLFSINFTILAGIFFQTQALNSLDSNIVAFALIACLTCVGLYFVWFVIDEIVANIPATKHLLSVHFWMELVLPFVFARYRRLVSHATCSRCRRLPHGTLVITGTPLHVRRSWLKRLWHFIGDYPSRHVVVARLEREVEHSTMELDFFVASSAPWFRVSLHLLQFRCNAWVFPFLKPSLAQPIVARTPTDVTYGVLTSSAQEAVEFWLQHPRTYEFEGVCRGVACVEHCDACSTPLLCVCVSVCLCLRVMLSICVRYLYLCQDRDCVCVCVWGGGGGYVVGASRCCRWLSMAPAPHLTCRCVAVCSRAIPALHGQHLQLAARARL